MATTKVQDLTSVGNIADGDVIVGERVTGTTVTMTFNGVLLDSEFSTNGLMTRTASGTYTSRTITGTTNEIDVADGDGVSGNPTLSMSATYIGQTSITTLGTITTGTWNGTAIDLANYVTGTLPVANGGTGATTLTDGGILLGSGTGAITATAVLADGEMVVGDGTTDPVLESGATLRTSIGVGTGDGVTFDTLSLNANSNQIVLDADDGSGFTTTITDSASAARTLTLPDATDTLTANAATQTLTNKTLDGNNNTIVDLAYDIAFNAGYDATTVKQDVVVQTYSEMVMARTGEIVGEAGYADTAPTGAALILDIEKNGTTVYSTKPQFAATSQTLTAGTLKTDGTEDFVSGDRITFKITQIGSTEPGEGIRFTLKCEV